MANPREVLLPRSATLTPDQVRLSRYGNVKIELLGVALARNQAQQIIDDYAANFPPAPIAAKDEPQPTPFDDDDDDPTP